MTITNHTFYILVSDKRHAVISEFNGWYAVSVSWSVYGKDFARFTTLKEAVKFARGRARVPDDEPVIR